ncbi:hypothetical protein HDV05_002236 [Chytridiales sp. JEL 0842]|nr:hypothetical protein HDV05_002236 [Chytridiales sp. JEL 0842]
MGTLHLKDAVHDFAVFPFPPSSSFNYTSLVEIAEDLYTSNSSSTTTSSSTGNVEKSRLTETRWIELASTRLGLNEEQAWMYWDAFCVFMGPEKCNVTLDAHVTTLTTSNDAPTPIVPSSATASTATTTLEENDNPSVSDFLQEYNPQTALLPWPRQNASPPAAEFLLLLFNQLSHRPSTTMHTNSVARGDKYPFPHHHPLPKNLPNLHFLTKRQHSSSTLLSETEDTFSSADESTHHRPTSSKTHATTSTSSSKTTNTHTSNRFPLSIISGRAALTEFWRTYAPRWLFLIHVLRKGRSVGTGFLHECLGGMGWTGVEALEMESGELDVLEFLFVGRLGAGSGGEVEYRLWMESEIEKMKRLQQHSGGSGGNGSGGLVSASHDEGHLSSEDVGTWSDLGNLATVRDVFISMNRNTQWTTFNAQNEIWSESWKVPLGAVANWVAWALQISPSSFRKMKVSENGVAYGIEEEHGHLSGNTDDPVILSRKRNITILVHPIYLRNQTLFIHRCNDATITLLGGPLKNLYISSCKNTQIFSGPVQAHVRVSNCDTLKLTVAGCGGFSASASSWDSCNELQVSLMTITRPLVCYWSEADSDDLETATGVSSMREDEDSLVESHTSLRGSLNGRHRYHHHTTPPNSSDKFKLCVSPLDSWYPTLASDLSLAHIPPLSQNLWDQVLLTWEPPSNTTLHTATNSEDDEPATLAETLWTPLPPSEYFASLLDVEVKQDHVTPKICPVPIPGAYLEWVRGCEEFTREVKGVMSKFSLVGSSEGEEEREGDEQGVGLQERVEIKFQEWMVKTGRVAGISGLLGAGKDLERMKGSVGGVAAPAVE